MGGQQGFSKITTNNLIFSYDVGDQRNSYKGKPGYNVASPVGYSIGNNNIIYDSTHYFITTIGTETVNIPALGTYNNVKYVTINNGYTGYGDGGNFNCCPSLFGYGSDITTGVTGNTLYTYSIIYKTQTGYTHPNFMYRYEYNGGTYLTETGVFDTSKRVDLGDGWYWAYNTFTTQATCNNLNLSLFYYQYNIPDKVLVKDAMLIQGDYKIPPLNFLSGNQTRSNTQGLLDLTRNRTIDLSDVSYDTNAQMYFDGTNDNINTGISNVGNNITYEAVAYCVSNISSYNMFFGQVLPYIGFYEGSQIIFSDAIGGNQQTIYSSGGSLTTGKWYHITCTRSYNGSSCTNTIYINSVQNGQSTFSGAYTGDGYGSSINIGDGQTTNWYPFNGYVGVAKIYNRALTQGEISQNYNHYKTRFNLS
jgi:hypothetical protein